MAVAAAVGEAGEEADAVVADPRQDAVVDLFEADGDPASAGVGAAVGQGLLRRCGRRPSAAAPGSSPADSSVTWTVKPASSPARRAYWAMAAARPTSSSRGGRSSNTSWRRRPTLSVAVAASRSSSSVERGSRRRPPSAWSWEVTATMAWMASSWMSPATCRRSSSWLVTTRSSSERRCLVELAQAAQGAVVVGDVAQHHQPADRRPLPVGHGHDRRLVAAGRPLPGHDQLVGQPVAGGVRGVDGVGRLGQQLAKGAAPRRRPGTGRTAARPAGWRRPPGAAGRAPPPPRRWSRRPAPWPPGGCRAAGTGTGPTPAPGRTRSAGTASRRSGRTAPRRSCRAG